MLDSSVLPFSPMHRMPATHWPVITKTSSTCHLISAIGLLENFSNFLKAR
jgi:hypothetical protein